jgi:hypothetical protein
VALKNELQCNIYCLVLEGPIHGGNKLKMHKCKAHNKPWNNMVQHRDVSSYTVVGIAYVLLLTCIWQAACGDLSGYHWAKQLCKGIHNTCISCFAQSSIKWRSVCGKQSPSARHGPWQRLGFKASSTLGCACLRDPCSVCAQGENACCLQLMEIDSNACIQAWLEWKCTPNELPFTI